MSHLSVVDIKVPGQPAELEAKISRAQRLLEEVVTEMNQAAGWHRTTDGSLSNAYAYGAGHVAAAEKLLTMVRLAVLFVKEMPR